MPKITVEDFNGVEDVHMCPAGERQLVCRASDYKPAEGTLSGMIQLRLEDVNDPLADDIYHTIWMLRGNETPKQRAKGLASIRTVLDGFGVDYEATSGGDIAFNSDDFVGKIAVGEVTHRTDRKTGVTRANLNVRAGIESAAL